MRVRIALLLGLLLLALLLTGIGMGQPHRPDAFSIPWWTVDGGGGAAATGGTYTLAGTAGQPDAGQLSGSTYTLSGGFWVSPGAGNLVYLPVVVRNPGG